MKYFIILLLLTSFHTPMHGQEQISPEEFEKIKQKKDLTYEDLAHRHRGCPENSGCNKKAAIDQRRWQKAIEKVDKKKTNISQLVNYIKDYGVYAPLMGVEDSLELYNSVTWTSVCEHHNKRVEKIRFINNFVKEVNDKYVIYYTNGKTKKAPRDHRLWADPIYLLNEKNHVQRYFAPRSHKPLWRSKGKLNFLLEEDSDIFFILSIAPEGPWRILPDLKIPSEHTQAQEVSCPTQLQQLTDEHPMQNVYSGSYCTQIWDQDLKKYLTIKRFWVCEK